MGAPIGAAYADRAIVSSRRAAQASTQVGDWRSVAARFRKKGANMYRDLRQTPAAEGAAESPAASRAATTLPPGRALSAGNQSSLVALLDELSFGVAVVDLRRQVLYASRIAAARLQGRGRLQVDGMIEAATRQDTDVLQQAIEVTRGGRRSYIALGWGGGATDIAVLPLPSWEVPAAALVFEKSQEDSGLGLYFFARSHNLTDAEERLLALLCDGGDVPTAAERAGCAVNTVRTHVRSLLRKTGLPTLRALVGRVGSLPAVGARVFSKPERES